MRTQGMAISSDIPRSVMVLGLIVDHLDTVWAKIWPSVMNQAPLNTHNWILKLPFLLIKIGFTQKHMKSTIEKYHSNVNVKSWHISILEKSCFALTKNFNQMKVSKNKNWVHSLRVNLFSLLAFSSAPYLNMRLRGLFVVLARLNLAPLPIMF